MSGFNSVIQANDIPTLTVYPGDTGLQPLPGIDDPFSVPNDTPYTPPTIPSAAGASTSAAPNATVPDPTSATVPVPDPATTSNPQPAQVPNAPSASNQASVTGTGSGTLGGFATDLFTKLAVFFIGLILLILGLVWALKQPMKERAAAAIDKAKSFAR